MAMRGLMQTVELQPASGIPDGRLEVVLSGVPLGQALECAHHITAQALLLQVLPVVECRAIPEGESSHKVAVEKRHRGDERVQTVGAGLVGRVLMRPAYRQVALELVHIDA